MRLLNVDTLKVEEFLGNPPGYATLSHQWGAVSEEIHLQSLGSSAQKIQDNIKQGVRSGHIDGISKIAGCCIQAKKPDINLKYIWVDTCCIDKTSSTELTEAINSMFNLYAESTICFAHLADVSSTPSDREFHAEVQRSRWFARGWTLQELLAPRKLKFFNRHWVAIGDKDSLVNDIQLATNISREHLENFQAASVATKMSWASERQTTRVEDRAYSLLGIFGVSMYLQYGERDKAFHRLQRAIIESSQDESIFAWTSVQESSGMLASKPDCFQNSRDIISDYKKNKPRPSHQIMHNTLEFHVPVLNNFFNNDPIAKSVQASFKKNLHITLNCWKRTSDGMRAIEVILRKEGNHWRRVNCRELGLSKKVPSNTFMFQNKTTAFALDL